MDPSMCACLADCGTQPHHGSWFVKDCCGIVCVVVTVGLLVFAEYVMIVDIIVPWFGLSGQGLVHATLFSGIVVLGLLSHYKAATTDPGAVPPNAVPEDFEPGDSEKNGFRCCHKCDCYKPERTHHCSVCRRCVVKMDHHCPWINNCVGLGNHKFFLLFLFYVFMSSVYAIALLSARFVHCTGKNAGKRSQRLRDRHMKRLHAPVPTQSPTEALRDVALDLAADAVSDGFFGAGGNGMECDLSVGANILVFVLVVEAILFHHVHDVRPVERGAHVRNQNRPPQGRSEHEARHLRQPQRGLWRRAALLHLVAAPHGGALCQARANARL